VDVVGSALALAVLGVPMLLIGLAVRLESPGPAIFRQRRAGRGGRCFTMLKFRTMRADADPYAGSPGSGDDPRVTGLGRWLRRTSLDELPQLMNILAGQMSLVGPRPLYERQAAAWTPRQRRRLAVRPGLTGYAQAFGRGRLTHEDKIEYDLFYVSQRSAGLDVRVVCRTILNIVAGGGRDVCEARYSRERERETDR
jgi:lipopolysaccharide/colanic/teichoic acid biosynthesis glycosyltransferase